jgi:Chromo (CHRromatin Organisation MOdifier) domain
MKPFLYDPAITNPLDVASRDHMEYFVEDILSHRGPHQRSKIEFLVKWLNYLESNNSWEPYANLRDVDKLHVYSRHNNIVNSFLSFKTISMRISFPFFYNVFFGRFKSVKV